MSNKNIAQFIDGQICYECESCERMISHTQRICGYCLIKERENDISNSHFWHAGGNLDQISKRWLNEE